MKSPWTQRLFDLSLCDSWRKPGTSLIADHCSPFIFLTRSRRDGDHAWTQCSKCEGKIFEILRKHYFFSISRWHLYEDLFLTIVMPHDIWIIQRFFRSFSSGDDEDDHVAADDNVGEKGLTLYLWLRPWSGFTKSDLHGWELGLGPFSMSLDVRRMWRILNWPVCTTEYYQQFGS